MKINVETLKTAIGEKMLARREIAEALGVSQQSVARWIAGQTAPKAEHARKLVTLLNINPKKLTITKQTKQTKTKER